MSFYLTIEQFSTRKEGQFFDRKSAFDRTGGRVRNRNFKDIAWDIAETLSAMANADGGELVIGLEDDGSMTGIPHPEKKLDFLTGVPGERNYVNPPLPYACERLQADDGKLILYFKVDWSPVVHTLADGRTLLRVVDSNMPFEAERIVALNQSKNQGLYERTFPPGARLEDIDLSLVEKFVEKTGQDMTPWEALEHYHLVDSRGENLVPCLAGLLLFGKDATRWHPRCGIEFIRWEGTERKHGAELNIVKRKSLVYPLSVLIENAWTAIKPFIRERHQLFDLFFSERLEYPTSVWQEALINAVAHRDYSLHGSGIEIHMFDDRLEIRSPGLPPQPVTVEALSRCEHIHISRNPLLVRILAELGYMQELGEGIPRMFSTMEREGFYPPNLEIIGEMYFRVTLRNQPVYDAQTIAWLRQFDHLELSGDQKRILAFARAHDECFTSREYQKLVGIDLYTASNSIKTLIRKGAVQSIKKGSRVYRVVEADQKVMPPEGLQRVLDSMPVNGKITNRLTRTVLKIPHPTAARYLREWVETGWLKPEGKGRGRYYTLVTENK